MKIDEFLNLLDGVKPQGADQWVARCPCKMNHKHGDKEQSLSVGHQHGKILVYCNTGCRTQDICTAMGLTLQDLYESEPKDRPKDGRAGFINWYAEKNGLKYVCEYSYSYGKYTDGLAKIRFVDGTGAKTFRWIRPDQTAKSGYKMTHKGLKPRLFVAGDIEASTEIIVVEGEKDADTVHAVTGLTAVSSENGATRGDAGSKWPASYNAQLEGKTVYILGDNDEIGASYQKLEINEISKTASAVYVMDLKSVWAKCPSKGDVTDLYEAFGPDATAEKIQQMKDGAKLATSAEPIQAEPATKGPDKTQPFVIGPDGERVPNLAYYHQWAIRAHGEEVPTRPFDSHIREGLTELYDIMIFSGIAWVYIDGHWTPDETGAKLRAFIEQFLYDQFKDDKNESRIANLILRTASLERSWNTINLQPETWANFRDCYVDFADGFKTHPHDPKYFTINQISMKWADVLTATAGPETDRFLNFAVSDPADKEMLLQFLGYSMTADNRQQRALLLYGDGSTGKSTILSLEREILGIENVSSVALQDLSVRFKASRLVGKLANISADLPATSVKDSSLFKMATGGDLIDTERKGRDGFTFQSYAKMIYSANNVPVFESERTNGAFRRMLLLGLQNKPTTKDPKLFEKLKHESSYFCRLCADAAGRMYDYGEIMESANSTEARKQSRIDSDVTEAWLDACTLADVTMETDRTELYENFKQYCLKEERIALKSNGFYAALRAKGYTERKSGGKRLFAGIRIY